MPLLPPDESRTLIEARDLGSAGRLQSNERSRQLNARFFKADGTTQLWPGLAKYDEEYSVFWPFSIRIKNKQKANEDGPVDAIVRLLHAAKTEVSPSKPLDDNHEKTGEQK